VFLAITARGVIKMMVTKTDNMEEHLEQAASASAANPGRSDAAALRPAREGPAPSPNRRQGLAVRGSVFDGRAGGQATETDARFRLRLRDSHARLGCRLIGDGARGNDGERKDRSGDCFHG
jgi:hypothetical protein